MADSKITTLTALTAADPINDMFPVVDVSDTSMAASGTTKKISVNNILSSSPTASGALTVTGLVTAGSATITGAATVTGAANLNGAVNLSTAGTATVTLGATATYGVLVGSGTNAASIYINGATRPGNAAMLQFGAAEHQWYNSSLSTLIATLNTTALTIANGNVVMGTANKGIDFSINSEAAGMTSELLNDYEEGTFTPTVIGTATAGTGTYTNQVGRYTKIGNLVTIQVYLSWTAHTGTGNMRFGNFPFNTASDAGSLSAAAIGYVNNIALTAGNILTAFTSVSNSFIAVYQTPVGGGASTEVPIDTSGNIVFTLTYRA